MTHVETRQYGAPRIKARNDANPERLLAKIVRRYPTAGDEKLAQLFRDKATEEELLAAIAYFTHNRRDPIVRFNKDISPEEFVALAEARQAARQERKQQTVAAADVVTKILYLGLTMPNGKILGDCTGREVAGFGSGFAKLSKMVKPNEKIVILGEAKVRSAFR